MKIAVAFENEMVFQHFGHTAQFKIYETSHGRVADSRIIDTAGSGHGALAAFLSGLQIDVLICGGIGSAARTALQDAGIQIFGGVKGDADEAVEAFLADTLEYDPNVRCSHHHLCGSNCH